MTKVYDAENQLTSVTNKNSGGTTLSSFSYAYNDDGLRTSCTEANGDVVSYGYDAAHRLTSESRSGTNSYSISYTLDGVGNRTAQTIGGTTTSFTYSNDDELTATSGGFTNSYSYNANGEQTARTLSGTAYSLSFDYDGQLTQITQGGSSVTYAYDALGRRYSRTAGGTTTVFQYAGNQVLLEKQGNATTATYTYGNALIRKDGEVPLFDGLGSERTVTDSSQSVTGTLTTEGFGQTVATTGSSTNPYMFAATSGYRTDGDAGLMHVGARYYDAQVGRFISRDTVLSEHPYIYCNADPVNALDPTGHVAALVAAGLGALAGIAIVGAIDYLDDGHFNRPWWHYGIGAGVGALIGVGVGAGTGGVAFGSLVVKIGIHEAHHFFPELGAKLPHIQINWWRLGVRGSGGVRRLPLPKWWSWK